MKPLFFVLAALMGAMLACSLAGRIACHFKKG